MVHHSDQGRRVNRHPIDFLQNPNDIEEALTRVAELRRQALRREGIDESDLTCDSTGLTKGASAGMVVACLPGAARLPERREEQTLRGTGPFRPVEVHIAYSRVSEE